MTRAGGLPQTDFHCLMQIHAPWRTSIPASYTLMEIGMLHVSRIYPYKIENAKMANVGDAMNTSVRYHDCVQEHRTEVP